MVLRWTAVLLYAGITLLLYTYGEQLLHGFRASGNLPVAVIIATLAALFPVIPYPVVAGVLGASFGTAAGGVTAWLGSTLASMIMFLLVRYGFQEWGQRVLRRHTRIEQATALFERNAFLAVLFARLIPVLPSVLINCYAALSRVRFIVYAAASAAGKIPSMLLFAVVGNQAVTEPRHIAAIVVLYGGFLGITLLIYRSWNSRTL